MANHHHRWPLAINVDRPENMAFRHRWPSAQIDRLWRRYAPLLATLGKLAIYGESPGKLGVFHRWPMAINDEHLAINGVMVPIRGNRLANAIGWGLLLSRSLATGGAA